MKKIAFDVMQNDNGPEAGIKAALDFVNNNSNYHVFLVGDETEIAKFLVEKHSQISIVHEPNVVPKTNLNLRKILREKTSMSKTLELLLEKKVDAVLSSGDSAAYLALATMKLKRLKNVDRPAFMPMIPKMINDEFFLLLDAGANLETKAEYLEQWAIIATIFSQNLFNKSKAICRLINIGTEDDKGFEYHQKANILLKNNPRINYQGFIETRNIFNVDSDIVLADGYTGNITLKTLEGSVLNLSKFIKAKITKTFWRKIFAIGLKKAFSEVKEKFDYRNVGAAWVIGVNGIVIKSHGSSDIKAYKGAFSQIKIAIESQILTKVKQEIEKISEK
ncbi:phosphate acyltransferase PlsX [Mesomycoplasma neurolyticum]|uniref:Phosphate acyltransferase n=1 Tax=Mesomycoplasma neurolyticum TaxID=2120 RepID=A0A449A4T9_9BACT|nr:phosphate acyltransferase PlsX [Mesomycoplasma neurolyticum]VEU59271.1 fatty acid/phospholipid synthesis protein PlsX [Mesomycoplasma neurolyticum]